MLRTAIYRSYAKYSPVLWYLHPLYLEHNDLLLTADLKMFNSGKKIVLHVLAFYVSKCWKEAPCDEAARRSSSWVAMKILDPSVP